MSGAAAFLLAAVVAQEPLTFSARAGLVRVEVLVLHRGKPVAGLSASDFEVREDGVVQQLQPAVEEEAPVDVALVLDTSASTEGDKLAALREAALAFVSGLREDEHAALLDFREEVRLLVPFTRERRELLGALGRVRPRGSTALRDAVYAGLHLHEPSERREAVVVFSDGVDSLSWLDADAVVEAARRSGALVYAVAVRERRDPEQEFLERVTEATGGRLWTQRRGDDLREGFLDVLRDIRARYVLSYTPPNDRPGWHRLDVRLRRGKGTVLARPAYWRAPPP